MSAPKLLLGNTVAPSVTFAEPSFGELDVICRALVVSVDPATATAEPATASPMM